VIHHWIDFCCLRIAGIAVAAIGVPKLFEHATILSMIMSQDGRERKREAKMNYRR